MKCIKNVDELIKSWNIQKITAIIVKHDDGNIAGYKSWTLSVIILNNVKYSEDVLDITDQKSIMHLKCNLNNGSSIFPCTKVFG